MVDLVPLGVRFTTPGADEAERHLDAFSAKAKAAKIATDDFSASQARQGGATNSLIASIERNIAEMARLMAMQDAAAASTDRQVGATNRLTNAQKLLERQQRMITMTGLNLSRQLADIGVTAAMGMNPLMILIQQGPQIADSLAMAKAEGIGFKEALAGMTKGAGPALAIIGAIAAVVAVAAAAFGLFHRELSKGYPDDITKGLGLTEEQLKRVEHKTVTFGDTFKATFTVLGRHIMNSPIGDALRWLGDAFNKTLDFIVKLWVDGWALQVGIVIGAFRTIRDTWKQFPAVIGDAVITATNFVIKTIEDMVNKAIAGINMVLAVASLIPNSPVPKDLRLPQAQLGRVANPFQGAMGDVAGQLGKNVTEATAQVKAGMVGIFKEIQAEAIKIARDRALKEAGDPNKRSGREAQAPRDMTDERSASVAASMAQAQQELLQAQLAVTRDLRARADIEHQLVDLAIAEKNAQIDKQIAALVDDKGLSDAKKAELTGQLEAVKLLQERVGEYRRRGIDDATYDALAKEQRDVRQAALDIEAEAMGYTRDAARTLAGRRDAELRLLELAQERERIELQGIIDSKTATEAQKAAAALRLANMGASGAAQREAIERANAGPLQQYADSLPRGAEEMAERLEQVKAKGLQGIEDGLVAIITRTKSVGDAFRDMAQSIIADLARIWVQQKIMGPLGEALGLDMGKNATGTNDWRGGWTRVGESGPENVWLPRHSMVVPADASREGPQAARGDTHITFAPKIDARGAGPREVDELKKELARMEAELPGKIITTVNEGQERGMVTS